MPTPGNGAIGALDWTEEERKRLAERSHSFDAKLPDDYMSHLKTWREKFPRLEENDDSLKLSQDTTKQFHFHDTKNSNSSSSSDETKEQKISDKDEKKELESGIEKKTRNDERNARVVMNTETRRNSEKETESLGRVLGISCHCCSGKHCPSSWTSILAVAIK